MAYRSLTCPRFVAADWQISFMFLEPVMHFLPKKSRTFWGLCPVLPSFRPGIGRKSLEILEKSQ
jgi:hypothetical protein